MIPGIYDAKVVRHEFKTSAGGTPSLYLTLCGEFGEGGEETIGHNLWITHKAMKNTKKALLNLGYDTDKEDIEALYNDEFALTGRECSIDIQEEEYKGSVSLKVKWLNAKGSGTIPDAEKLKKMFKKVKLTDDDKPMGDAAGPEGEDIPF